MEGCTCGNSSRQYYDVVTLGCEDKEPNGVYDSFNEKGQTKCWNRCQINASDPRCLKKSIENHEMLNIFRIIQFLSSNINVSNPYTMSLINPANLSKYEPELAEIPAERIRELGSAKILAKGYMNNELSDIMNIYGAFLFIQTKDTLFAGDELDKFKNLIYLIEAMGDLGCSAGSLNVYFQGIEREYNFPKFSSIEELASLITVEKFKISLKEKMLELVQYIQLSKQTFLDIEYTVGDKIGGEGNGPFNKKYLLFYIVKFLVTNKNLKTIEGLTFAFDDEILSKFTRLDEHATKMDMEGFGQKYLKYKTKYLKLKKLLNKTK